MIALQFWNDSDAAYRLGEFYRLGEHTEKDITQATEWYRRATKSSDAYYRLGCCYAKGEGVKQDYNQAALCFKAAKDENYDAAYCYGIMLVCGLGTDKNEEDGELWLKTGGPDPELHEKVFLDYIVNQGLYSIRKDDARRKVNMNERELLTEECPELQARYDALSDRENALRVDDEWVAEGYDNFLQSAGLHLIPLALAVLAVFVHDWKSSYLLICTALYGASFLFVSYLLYSVLKKAAVGIAISVAATGVYYSRILPILTVLAVAVGLGISLYLALRVYRYMRAKERRRACGKECSDRYWEIHRRRREEYIKTYHEDP